MSLNIFLYIKSHIDNLVHNAYKKKKIISNYTFMSTCSSFGFVFIRERYSVMACYDVDYE